MCAEKHKRLIYNKMELNIEGQLYLMKCTRQSKPHPPKDHKTTVSTRSIETKICIPEIALLSGHVIQIYVSMNPILEF